MNFISSGVPPKPALSSKCEALAIYQSSCSIGLIIPFQLFVSFAKALKENKTIKIEINIKFFDILTAFL